MKLLTTLNIIRSADPCSSGWTKLLKSLGKSKADDEPLTFDLILKSNGLDDALWALRAVLPKHEKDRDRLARLFACYCAESCLAIYETRYPGDLRPRQAIEAGRQWGDQRCSPVSSRVSSR